MTGSIGSSVPVPPPDALSLPIPVEPLSLVLELVLSLPVLLSFALVLVLPLSVPSVGTEVVTAGAVPLVLSFVLPRREAGAHAAMTSKRISKTIGIVRFMFPPGHAFENPLVRTFEVGESLSPKPRSLEGHVSNHYARFSKCF